MSDWHAAFAASTESGRARALALRAFAAAERGTTSLVEYESAGNVLVIGPRGDAVDAANRLGAGMHRLVVATDHANEVDLNPGAATGAALVMGQVSRLQGHLGRFDAAIRNRDGSTMMVAALTPEGRTTFDLVLDFSQPPLIATATVPVGYFPISDPASLERALHEAPELVGTFEKPKYFNLNTDLCAHSRSNITGCTRCLGSCPTGAITAIEDFVRIDPYLCQGVGICATACPAGAIVYAYPQPRDLLLGIRQMLTGYQEAGGQRPVVLFHDDEAGREMVAAAASGLPEQVLPVAVEDVASVGMDTWLSTLAYGAERVVLLWHSTQAATVATEARVQLDTAWRLLEAMAHGRERLLLIEPETASGLAAMLMELEPRPALPPARFATFSEKRGTLRLALDHLHAHAPADAPEAVALAPGAPFGRVLVDQQACTLCMGCVQVCPSHALSDNPDQPQLGFTESLCVQCGLCERACPENAITLESRYTFDAGTREHRQVLNEEQPFHCIACGKAFATLSIISRMTEALSGHHMFQTEAERRRLRMCGDCRVKDLMLSEREGGRRVS